MSLGLVLVDVVMFFFFGLGWLVDIDVVLDSLYLHINTKTQDGHNNDGLNGSFYRLNGRLNAAIWDVLACADV